MIGNSVALAAREARGRLVAVLAKEWSVPAETIRTAAGEAWAEGTNHRVSMTEAVHLAKSRGVVPVGAGTFGTDTTGLAPGDGAGRPWQAYVFGAQVAEVEVDTVTGEVQVLGIWAAHDVGRAVNPRGVEGQIEGGVVQALGQALMEDYKLDKGHTTTPGFAKYILPTSLDVPRITSVIVEDPDPIGPLGVKGIGEPAMVPTIPAIMNAIYDAVGVRITSLPATPEKVRAALRTGASAASAPSPRNRSASRSRCVRRRSRVIRQMATVLPGALPLRVNGIRVAASIRPQKFVIEGGDDTPVTMPRTAFQVVYPDGTVMIDAGLDAATHASFSPDKPEPYFPEAFARLTRALDAARLIVFTHHHADHVAGVLTAPNALALARKTIITRRTGRLMADAPHRPHLKVDDSDLAEFITLDYTHCYPVAPGLVLIDAPGHSPDHQMVYVRLADGREILDSVDVGWILNNIAFEKPKSAPWVKEDVPAIRGQLAWLNGILKREPDVTLLVTHDDALFEELVAAGKIGGDVEV